MKPEVPVSLPENFNVKGHPLVNWVTSGTDSREETGNKLSEVVQSGLRSKPLLIITES